MTKLRLPLLLILLLALGLRLIALSSRTLWYDEAFAVLFSEKGLSAMLYGTLTPVGGAAADVHPLLYYGLLDGWMRIFGQSVAAVRLLSVLCGLLTIYGLYLLARELFDERTGLVAALIAAVAPFSVQYSQEARMYALLGLLLISATYCFIKGWRTYKAAYWIAFGVLAGLAMYTQQLAGFYLIALGLVPIVVRRRDQLIRLALSAGLAILIYFPWLVNLPAQFGKIGAYWIAKPTPIQFLVTLWSFLFADLPVTAMLPLIASVITLVLLLILLFYRAADTFRLHRKDSMMLAFALWLANVPMALMWLVSQWRSVYLTRALLPSGLIFYIALAWLLTRARLPSLIVGLVSVSWLITIVLGLSIHYTWNTFPRPPFDTADRAIADVWQEGDRVVHANKLTLLPMVYYNRTLAQSYVRDTPGSGEDTLAIPTQKVLNLFADNCISAAAHGSSRIWFVIFQRQIAEESGASPSLGWLNVHYRQVSVEAYNDLLIYLYERPDATAQQAICEDQP
ncbi:MAG: glycosyltransferase family 39 protein [Chloroflexota bacterium]